MAVSTRFVSITCPAPVRVRCMMARTTPRAASAAPPWSTHETKPRNGGCPALPCAGTTPAHAPAVGILRFDAVGAEVGEQARRQRAEDGMREVEHQHARQRQRRSVLLRLARAVGCHGTLRQTVLTAMIAEFRGTNNQLLTNWV